MSSPARGSLRLRLLAGSLIWIIVALTVTGFVLADLFRQHVTARFEAELHGHLDQLIAVFEPGDGSVAVSLRAPLSDPRLREPFSGLYWQIDGVGDAQEVALLRSRSLWDATLAVPADAPRDGEVHVHHVTGPQGAQLLMTERLIRTAEQPERPYRLIVAADERDMIDPVREFIGLLSAALIVLGTGLVAAVIVQVGVGLAPLARMRDALGAVRAGSARHLDGAFPKEVQPLVDELNTLLRHDAEMVARARTQAGNLAHAVKTPLAVLANAAAREQSELAHLVTEQVAAAQRQVDHHLARARAAAAVEVPGLRTPLRPVVDGLVRVMQRVHAARDLEIDADDVDAALAFRGEEQDLQEMLGNLIDNACKWAGHRVVVRAAADAGRLVIRVEDDGPGLPAAERDAVFARGVRADEHQPGSGLGLSIVRELARLYGGDASFEDGERGLHVVLTLPAA